MEASSLGTTWIPRRPSVIALAKTVEQEFAKELNLDELFSLGHIQLNSFAKKLADLKKKRALEKTPLKEIDFSRVGHITDAAIQVLVNVLGKESFNEVNRISLEGCSVLTDLGLHWLVQALEGDTANILININGCTKVTDSGLAALLNCPRISNIEAIATSVSHFNLGHDTRGCPLLTSSSNSIESSSLKESYMMIIPIGTKESLAEYLVSSNGHPRNALHYHQQVAIQDWKLNVVEAERSHVLFQHLLPQNPVQVLIPFDASLDLNVVKGEIEETIAHVLSKEQPNPFHKNTPNMIVHGSNSWLDCSLWNRTSLSMDGTIRNISTDTAVSPGVVISRQPLSRTNHYFEVKVLRGVKNSDASIVVMGAMFDVLYLMRFPTDSKERQGGVIDGLPLKDGVTYSFGVDGEWLSEYVPGPDAEFYFAENGEKILEKRVERKPQIGMYPLVMVHGSHLGTVQIVNKLVPPEAVQDKWLKEKMFHTPAFKFNMLCDDEGIVSYAETRDAKGQTGWIQTQDDMSGKNNVFAIRIIEMGTGTGSITIGFGPENYPLNAHPGWRKHSFALHGDNGKIYSEQGTGITPKSGGRTVRWKNGDIIKMIISDLKGDEVVSDGITITIDFFVNNTKVAHESFKIKDYDPSKRMLFMVGMNTKGAVAQILNFRPLYLNPPPKMNMLTMGRCNFMDIMDDGTLRYKPFDQKQMFSLYMSKTPFNQQLQYFEVKVKKLDKERHCGIGLCHLNFPINNMLGWMPGSIGYHADNGEIYCETKDGVTLLSEDNDCPYRDGDTVGCGIDGDKADFRPDGTLVNQQTLIVYFTKNGKRIHALEYKHRTEGLYPAVNLHFAYSELQLKNYYPGSEAGGLIQKAEASKAAEKTRAKKDLVEGCQFTVVGMGHEKSDPRGKTASLQKMMSNGPQFSMLPLIDKKLAEMNGKPEAMGIQEQQKNAALSWQRECLQRFPKTKSRLNFTSVDTSSAEGVKELHGTIIKTCENELAMHSKFYDMPLVVETTMKAVTTILKAEKLFAAHRLLKIADEKYFSNGRIYEVLVRYLQKQGRMIWLPMKRTVVAIDMAFAETLVRMSGTLPTTPSLDMAPCIGQDTKVWMQIADVVPDLKQLMESKSDLMSHVLLFFGLIEVPCVRKTKEDPMFCYCTPKGIGQLPVTLDHFLSEGRNDVIVIRRDYRFLYNHPENILSLIVSRCLIFSRPVAISPTWCVFQSGAAQIAIYVKDLDLIIETRSFMPSIESHALNKDTKKNVQEYSWHIFCIFIDLIELIITRLRLKTTYSQKVPAGLVNTSIGCLHSWGLSEETYRQTRCTLCNMCCEKGRNCQYNRVPGMYEHQCGCGTIITGCRDCGICQTCADTLWTIRSYLRPNMEVASYGDMKSCQLFPLNATTYDEIEITNLGRNPAPICLRSFFDLASSLTLMFPGMAMEVPSASSVEKVIYSNQYTGELAFSKGDIVTVRLDPIKRDHKVTLKQEEIEVRPSEPVYFTSICRDITVWHDVGILAYTSVSTSQPVSQFISAMPLTPEVNSFSIEIINRGRACYIAIGVCPKRYMAGRQPGWNSGSVGYHADDGGLFNGRGSTSKKMEKCTTGDIMKCEVDFEGKIVRFYKNGVMMHEAQVSKTSGYHAAIGLHSRGEAVRLLEKEPWSVKEVEESTLPNAFDSYKYGNMYISPGRTLSLFQGKNDLSGWLLLYNPSKNVVGYKILISEDLNKKATFLKPGQTRAELLCFPLNKLNRFTTLDIHWFMLESSRDYSDVDMEEIYQATTHESLLMHRLIVKMKGVGQADFENLKMATVDPDSSDGYLAEVFKNGLSIRKYWLRDGSYVCSIPIESEVLVRYPKFPTLNHPDSLQKGMRLIVDLSATEKDTFAEGWVQEVTPNGSIKLQYSLPGKSFNSTIEVPSTSPVINLKEIKYEKVLKAMPGKKEGGEPSEATGETTLEAALNILSYEPRGNTSAIKSAYKFAPFHLLTKASQDALRSLDSSWESTTLQSVALCKTTPTRVTVQELQIGKIAGDNLDWLLGANPSRKYDVAFAFLPSQLDLLSVTYPSLPAMFNNIDVHRLCLQTDQMNLNLALSKEHGIIPDMPLHFVNIIPVTPSPVLSAATKYASAFNAWTYSTLYLNKMLLPKCGNMFHGGSPPELERIQLEQTMKTLIHIYASQCHLFAEQHGGIAFQETPENGTELISSSIKHKNNVLIREPETVETADDVLLRPFKQKNNAYCKAHLYCTEGAAMLEEDTFTMRFEQVTPYQDTINFIYRKMPGLVSLPPKFFHYFKNLQYLKMTHCDKLFVIPNGISECTRLEFFCLESSAVVQLPEDFFQVPSLSTVHCSGLLIQSLPRTVTPSCLIKELKLCSMQLQSVPPELGLLVSLEVLNLDSNPLKALPMELATLLNLKSLHLCGIKWLFHGSAKTELPLHQYEEFLETECSLANFLGREKALGLFKEYDRNNNAMLDNDEISALNSFLFWNIPRVGSKDISDTDYGGFPPVIFMLTSLEHLYLDYQSITFVPEHIGRLQNLRTLSVCHNPLLERLSGALGHSPSLKSIRVVGNPSLQTPPHEVYARGFLAIKAYLKRLAEGLSECRRTKLMFVGLGGAGKTSLLKSLMSMNKMLDEKTKEEVTDGIMIAPWTVKTSDDVEITYSTWDFAGQTLYYNTHQFFLSKRAVYLLLWSARQGFEHSGIDFWLNSIVSHTSEAPIFVVATHCDEVPQAPIPKEDLLKRYPQIAGFFFVSSKTGANIRELEQEMLKVTLAQKNMGEQVPQVWLNLEKKILGARHQDDILEWEVIKRFSIDVGLYDDKDIREAISFLNELGTVQYFDTDFLRDKIVINPQWIVNVMACVVSVKDSPIQDQLGRFLHKDIPKIWSMYDQKLHTWLLQLTEEFDLTFPLPKEEVNIVPCILPQEQPKEFHWPKPDYDKNMKETKIVYKFDFLPAGLFNRAQVRLFQLSDGKLMWKKGSLLKKNKHLALVEQMTECELVVKVQGPRPENVIFLIHEIFESLVDESFHGVRYDFMVPCPDCIEKEHTLEPSLFEGYLIRKASEFRAPFLQCRKFFHTISMTQLLEIMPSNSTTDFDAHLQTSLQILQELNNAFAKDIAILSCPHDAKHCSLVDPKRVRCDLEAAGYSCWLSEDVPEHELTMAIKNCRILVVLCSDNFENNEKFRNLLMYSLDSLQKTYVIVAVGDSQKWMNTSMGMRIGKQELMVMISSKSNYETKIKEIMTLVENKLTGLGRKTRKFCSVFLSYCWENSSIAKNGENKPGSVGWGDPRTIKQQLEERGISCWLDVENIASCSGENKGLFQTIAEAMNNSKVILVCISDEYFKSENCIRELRFAVLNLKKPVIFAAVGTGKKWKKSEAELLRGESVSSEMTVDFQTRNEKGYDQLATYIQQLLPSNVEQVIQKEAIQKDMEAMQAKEKQKKESGPRKPDKESVQEECELVQRKFMRYIISYVSSQDTVLAPRLFVIDFEKSAKSDDKDMADGSARSSVARPAIRPKTANRSSRNIMMPANLDDDAELWESERFCVKLLCENEQGWHVCRRQFPIRQMDAMKGLIQGCSAYLARMYAILRQSNVILNCFDGAKGEKFLAWVEESAVNDVNFVQSYTTIRSELVEDDGAQSFLAQLNRYHLPTGKIYWLCREHSKGPRILHLSTETVTNKEVMRILEDEDIKMRENMEAMVKSKRRESQGKAKKTVLLPSVNVSRLSSLLDENPDESNMERRNSRLIKAREKSNLELTADKMVEENMAKSPASPPQQPQPSQQPTPPSGGSRSPSRQSVTATVNNPPPPAAAAASSSKPPAKPRQNLASAKSSTGSSSASKTCALQ